MSKQELYNPTCGHNLWTFTLSCPECKKAQDSFNEMTNTPEMKQAIKDLKSGKILLNPSEKIRKLLKINKPYRPKPGPFR